MRRIGVFFLIGFVFFGCVSIPKSTESLYEWGAYSVPPSRIIYNGDIIMGTAPYNDGARCIVYYEHSLVPDATYYYMKLMQDFGWMRNSRGSWSGNGYARNPQEGTMYINPALRVAVYFYPSAVSDEGYGVYRVSIIKE